MKPSSQDDLVSLAESTDPSITNYKLALKNLGRSIKYAHKSSEGKKLSTEYWTDILSSLKRAKLGISMMELGIDDEEEVKDIRKTSNTNKNTEETPEGDDNKDNTDDKTDGSDASTKNKLQALGLKNEASRSKSQQRLFGMVHAYNKGELKKNDVDPNLFSKIKKIANNMSDKDAKKMAKTNHTDLPDKIPTDEYYDTLNHLGILLSEENFNNIEGTGCGFVIEKEGRKFIIEFNDRFYMVSENYNFELGDTRDLSGVVKTFSALTRQSDESLKHEYNDSF